MYVLQISDVQVKGDQGTLLSVRSWRADGACAAGLTETAPHPALPRVNKQVLTIFACLQHNAAWLSGHCMYMLHVKEILSLQHLWYAQNLTITTQKHNHSRQRPPARLFCFAVIMMSSDIMLSLHVHAACHNIPYIGIPLEVYVHHHSPLTPESTNPLNVIRIASSRSVCLAWVAP